MTIEFVALALGADALGAVRFSCGQVVESLVLPIPGQRGPVEALRGIAGLPLVAHGLAPTRTLLDPALVPAASRWVDTQVLAAAVWPGAPDLTLPALSRRFGLPLNDDPASQAKATGLLLLRALAAAAALPLVAQALVAEVLPDATWIGPPPVSSSRTGVVPVPRGVDEAFAALTNSGLLARREGQLAYARAVAETFAEGGIRLLEAGPGTGKTIGYLIPLLLTLARQQGRAVIATRTRALQEQLWRRDLPSLRDSLGGNVPGALLKGRENYLCRRRFEEVRRQLIPREVLVPLLAWAAQTETGDLDELAALRTSQAGQEVLRHLPDIPYRCGVWACPFWDRCPSRLARDKARVARLVVVNHALLGADLASGGTILGPYDFLVVDEAHALPEAMRDALSATLSPAVIPRLLGELRRGSGGILSRLADAAGAAAAVEAWDRAVAAHRAFWATATATLSRETGRYGSPDIAPVAPAGAILSDALAGLADAVAQIAQNLPDEDASRARSVGSDVRRLADLVSYLLRPAAEETVFWYARDPYGLTLAASPVDVGETLGAALWPSVTGGILTSATLSVGDAGAALTRELGLDPATTRFATWPSPFPYDRVQAFVLRYLPHPDDPQCPEAVAATLRQILQVPRRALALFTSRRALAATAAHLGGTPHLVQGRDGEREQLLDRFRNHAPPVILLGLHTLWEGIDLPGEELELLVVVRLPFPVPTDPVTEAQTERILGRGGNPFQELFLPRAVLRLRQGVGRLVRTPTDRGALLLADPRLATHGYGETFLRALPVPARWVDDPDQLPVALARLFR
ncbi:TPA: hypothetical protein DCY67_01125 [Candidatus Acetothermia bacterium]|nr:hypothetical protein [Candidatus Acetothermia bacterium]